jgi:hypothetical protein
MTAPDADLHASAFFLADHAVVENGKLYANGAFWNRLNFPTFPAISTFSVVAVLHIPWRDYHRTHQFSVRFEDADAQQMPARFDGEFQIGSAPDMKVGDPTIMPIAATVGSFVFPTAGDYAAVLRVDGAEIARWQFRTVQASQQMRPQGPPGPADIPTTP